MASVKIAGNVFVIESAFTKKELQTVKKYRPALLALQNEDKKEFFRIGFGTEGSVNSYGIEFDDETAGETKVACLTCPIPAGDKDARTKVADYIGTAILNLAKVEENLLDALADIEEEQANVLATIEVI